MGVDASYSKAEERVTVSENPNLELPTIPVKPRAPTLVYAASFLIGFVLGLAICLVLKATPS